MNSNTHSTQQPGGLHLLAAAVDQLAGEDLDALPDSEAAQQVLVLRRLIERLEGHWPRELAGVNGRGAAGTDHGTPAESTAGWLRHPPAWATPTPTNASASPERCTAARWPERRRPWRRGSSAICTPPR